MIRTGVRLRSMGLSLPAASSLHLAGELELDVVAKGRELVVGERIAAHDRRQQQRHVEVARQGLEAARTRCPWT